MTAVSLMLAPWFGMSIARRVPRDEFFPRPRVDVVGLRIAKRGSPILHDDERERWNAFVLYALCRSKSDARRTFRNLISHLQWRLLCRDLGIAADARLDSLSLEQWLGVYRFVLRCVPRHRLRLIGAPSPPPSPAQSRGREVPENPEKN